MLKSKNEFIKTKMGDKKAILTKYKKRFMEEKTQIEKDCQK